MSIYDQFLEIHEQLIDDEMWLTFLEEAFEELEVDNFTCSEIFLNEMYNFFLFKHMNCYNKNCYFIDNNEKKNSIDHKLLSNSLVENFYKTPKHIENIMTFKSREEEIKYKAILINVLINVYMMLLILLFL